MIIDINTFIGHYPFRRLRFAEAAALVDHLECNGIDRAVVGSLSALLYRDVQTANEDLFAQTRHYAGRLFPAPTINPRYVGWQRDLDRACGVEKARVVALAPNFHGYTLTDETGDAVLRALTDRDVPVMLVQRYEDRRQRHAWDRAEDLDENSLFAAARAHPRLRFLLVNWSGLNAERAAAAGLRGRCLLDLARVQVVNQPAAARLMDGLGADALGFGTHVPFDYVGPSLVKLDNLKLLHPQRAEAVAWRNAARFLRLD